MTMAPWDRFEQLARKARLETIPPLDVAPAVTAALRKRAGVAPPLASPLLAVLAGLSILAASVMMAVSADAWTLLIEPPTSLLGPLSWVLL